MQRYVLYILCTIIIINCTSRYIKNDRALSIHGTKYRTSVDVDVIKSRIYDNDILYYAKRYGVDASLIKAIIEVESNYDPNVVSKSNAIGLMQLKADTAGKDVYRFKGWIGKPSVRDLKNASINIELGTVYLFLLQKQLEGITDPLTRRYAIIVSYVNGIGTLLKIFSVNRDFAIQQINKLNPDQFYQYIQYHHPSNQAKRYLFKVNSVYMLKSTL